MNIFQIFIAKLYFFRAFEYIRQSCDLPSVWYEVKVNLSGKSSKAVYCFFSLSLLRVDLAYECIPRIKRIIAILMKICVSIHFSSNCCHPLYLIELHREEETSMTVFQKVWEVIPQSLSAQIVLITLWKVWFVNLGLRLSPYYVKVDVGKVLDLQASLSR